MKKSKRSKKIKLPPVQYVNTNCPIATDVDDFLKAIRRFRLKNGSKPYIKNRVRCDALVRRLLSKHHVAGTVSARFWYMEGICILIQKTPEQLQKDFKRAHAIAKRVGK